MSCFIIVQSNYKWTSPSCLANNSKNCRNQAFQIIFQKNICLSQFPKISKDFPGFYREFFYIFFEGLPWGYPSCFAAPRCCSSTRCIQPLLPKPMTAALKRNISLKVLGLPKVLRMRVNDESHRIHVWCIYIYMLTLGVY